MPPRPYLGFICFVFGLPAGAVASPLDPSPHRGSSQHLFLDGPQGLLKKSPGWVGWCKVAGEGLSPRCQRHSPRAEVFAGIGIGVRESESHWSIVPHKCDRFFLHSLKAVVDVTRHPQTDGDKRLKKNPSEGVQMLICVEGLIIFNVLGWS